MAKLNGSILLSVKQIGELGQGKIVTIHREGKTIEIGVKGKHIERVKLLAQIKELKAELRKMRC